jgi:hypothetical protein
MRFLKALWAKEPVLVTAGIPFLAALGVITADQSQALTSLAQAVVAAVTVFAPAVFARSQVISPASASHPVAEPSGPVPPPTP